MQKISNECFIEYYDRVLKNKSIFWKRPTSLNQDDMLMKNIDYCAIESQYISNHVRRNVFTTKVLLLCLCDVYVEIQYVEWFRNVWRWFC